MNKKFFESLLTFMMVAMLSVGFASCGGDDEDDNLDTGGNKSVVDEGSDTGVDETSQLFIGKWSGYGTWEFRADGTCTYSYNNTYNGTWKYVSKSKTLITDILNWNWNILSVTENQWTGTHLAGKKGTHTYNRVK